MDSCIMYSNPSFPYLSWVFNICLYCLSAGVDAALHTYIASTLCYMQIKLCYIMSCDFGTLNLYFYLSAPVLSCNSRAVIVEYAYYQFRPTPFADLLLPDRATAQHTRDTCSAHAWPQRFAYDYRTRTATWLPRAVCVQ